MAKLIKTVEENLPEPPAGNQKDLSSHIVTNSRKLKFKNKTENKRSQSMNFPVADTMPRKLKLKRKPMVTKPAKVDIGEIFEYGEGEYRFIAFDKNDIPEEKETEPPKPEEGSTHVYYEDELFRSYLDQWQDIIKTKNRDSFQLVFPVRSGKFEDVTMHKVAQFLKSKSIVKLERIRWHPDKINLLLKDKIEIDWDQIRHTFQIINYLYENWESVGNN